MDAIWGTRDGWEVRFDSSIAVKDDNGDVVFCSSAPLIRHESQLTAVYEMSQTKKSCSTRYLAAAIVSDRLISADKAS
jgi:hypothetical protein